MSQAAPRQVAESYWAAESQRDIEAVMSFYCEDATLRIQGRWYRGKKEIRTFYDGNFAEFPALEVTIVNELVTGDQSAFEWEAVFTDVAGKRYGFRGINVFRIEAGRFLEVRPYFETSLPSPIEAGDRT